MSTLADLAAAPDQATISRLWTALPAEDRLRALQLAVAEDRQLRTALVGVLRQTPRYRGFRPTSFTAWPVERLAAAANALPMLPPEVSQAALIALHLTDRAEMLAAFLDAVRIPHDHGMIQDLPESLPVTQTDLESAATDLAARFPADQVTVYFLTLMLLEPALWVGLGAWLAGRGVVDEQLPGATNRIS